MRYSDHDPARRWFDIRRPHGWATTPVTELGFVRVSSNRKVIPDATTPGAALQVLRALCELDGHQFWADECRLIEPPFVLDRLGSHQQVTDVHLAALAARNGGTLATFDRAITRGLAPEVRDVVELVPVD